MSRIANLFTLVGSSSGLVSPELWHKTFSHVGKDVDGPGYDVYRMKTNDGSNLNEVTYLDTTGSLKGPMDYDAKQYAMLRRLATNHPKSDSDRSKDQKLPSSFNHCLTCSDKIDGFFDESLAETPKARTSSEVNLGKAKHTMAELQKLLEAQPEVPGSLPKYRSTTQSLSTQKRSVSSPKASPKGSPMSMNLSKQQRSADKMANLLVKQENAEQAKHKKKTDMERDQRKKHDEMIRNKNRVKKEEDAVKDVKTQDAVKTSGSQYWLRPEDNIDSPRKLEKLYQLIELPNLSPSRVPTDVRFFRIAKSQDLVSCPTVAIVKRLARNYGCEVVVKDAAELPLLGQNQGMHLYLEGAVLGDIDSARFAIRPYMRKIAEEFEGNMRRLVPPPPPYALPRQAEVVRGVERAQFLESQIFVESESHSSEDLDSEGEKTGTEPEQEVPEEEWEVFEPEEEVQEEPVSGLSRFFSGMWRGGQ